MEEVLENYPRFKLRLPLPNRNYSINMAYWTRDLTCAAIYHVEKRRSIHLPKLIKRNGQIVEKLISRGGQGLVYTLKDKSDRYFVTKITQLPASTLIEADILRSFDLHPPGPWHTYRIKGLGYTHKKKLLEVKSLMRSMNISYIFPKGHYCIHSSFIKGKELKHLVKFVENVENLKYYYAFIILLLKQLQAIHFTLNQKDIIEQTMYRANMLTFSHQDIHIRNIMMVEHRFSNTLANYTSKYNIPILIDYGFSPASLYTDYYDYKVGLYNHLQRMENHIQLPNVIRKDRIFSIGQNTDFCTLGFLIANIFTKTLTKSKPPVNGICQKARRMMPYVYESIQKMREPKRIISFLPFMEDRRTFLVAPLLELLFSANIRYQTYQTWINIVKFFDPERKEQVPLIRSD
ncbi:hypothetical protein SNEBB_005205 [Seison nebaliae]|nr:hypothetical protein SNEBB_005205 [Seison nebaliae]